LRRAGAGGRNSTRSGPLSEPAERCFLRLEPLGQQPARSAGSALGAQLGCVCDEQGKRGLNHGGLSHVRLVSEKGSSVDRRAESAAAKNALSRERIRVPVFL